MILAVYLGHGIGCIFFSLLQIRFSEGVLKAPKMSIPPKKKVAYVPLSVEVTNHCCCFFSPARAVWLDKTMVGVPHQTVPPPFFF